ncbi:MAG: cytochrome c peroxidase [Sulfurimonas sp.]|jgi:cytochrome c peroxidase
MKIILIIFIITCNCLAAAEPIVPIPLLVPYNSAKATLGKKLFFDPILSQDYTITCASCHDISHGGADRVSHSIGVHGTQVIMNTPTVFNAVFNFSQFWNGRAATLSEQALGPIHNPLEMGLPLREAAKRLEANPEYKATFFKITKHPTISPDDIAQMIAEYEKTLITPNGKFDRYLRGQTRLSSDEMQGYALFKTLGCVSCHNGVNVGGNSFQKMGAIIPIHHNPNIDDRYAITKKEWDKNIFKVPTLRNISLTAPYFHDSSSRTLRDAVSKMGYNNLGLKLSKKEIDLLVTFLDTLTGERPLQREQL